MSIVSEAEAPVVAPSDPVLDQILADSLQILDDLTKNSPPEAAQDDEEEEEDELEDLEEEQDNLSEFSDEEKPKSKRGAGSGKRTAAAASKKGADRLSRRGE
jgi:hypothetical protein